LIVNAWKRKFGPGLKGVIVGGAALSEEIARFFSSSGIRIREGYGLTETSPAITFNRYSRKRNRFGTVGIPIQNVNVRIHKADEAGQGEIEVKGPNVMLGYYKNQAATDEKLTKDGWLKTGDIGYFSKGKFLKITGRASNIYKNASGRFVTPTGLERELESHHAILQVMVYGYNRPYNIAIIIPDFEWLKKWAEQHEIHWTDNAYMIHNPKVQDLYDNILIAFNKRVKSHERMGKYILGKSPWSREDGLLSVTMKLRRNQIFQEFEKQIKEVYQKPIER
jgi:long-chain acyl-CoA synthetase